MAEYFDAEGNKVEGILTKEEAEKLATEKAAAEKKALEEAHAKKLAEIEEDHKKHLAKKTDEIVRMKDMTKEQLDKMTAKEIEDQRIREAALEAAEGAKREVEEMRKQQIEGSKSAALDKLGIYDEEARKKALLGYDKIIGDMKTPEEVFAKMSEAVNMMGLNQGAGHGGFRAPGATGGSPEFQGGAGKSFADTAEGRELAAKLNLGFINEKK